MNSNPLQAILGIFNKLNPKQKFMMVGGILLTGVLLVSMLFMLNEPSYSTLYSGLAAEDASKVIDHLSSQKILYKIEDNGQTIKVPKEKLYETRLSLAGKGIPSSGMIGYEIFDKANMGMSEFMQKLNYKRALEGEIGRTIGQIDGVQAARVHIVIPQKSIFKEDEKEPTASVVLKLKGNGGLSKENILSIVNLVSSSVEGLPVSKVSVIDTHGRILSSDTEEGPLAFASNKQYEIKQTVERYLANKAQSILDNVLGVGNAMVQINADINFDQVEKTMEQYDPDSQVAISEQTVKTNNEGKSYSDSTSATNQNIVTNYEINKTIQKVVEGSGNISRLSVAAVINDVAKEVKNGEKTEIVFEPRSQEQLKKLENLVKNAVGLDLQRNDQFSLVSIPFEVKPPDNLDLEDQASLVPQVDQYINLVLILVAIVSSILVLKSLMKKLKNEKIIIGTYNAGGGDISMPPPVPAMNIKIEKSNAAAQLAYQRKRQNLPIGDLEDEISEEALVKKNQQEKIVNYVSKNPVDAAKLINAWMHEDEI
ncbi:flagellar M-ring protein FliF [bacterium BRH_c32]|nr:MAG: flagellar M-ring protein FliF [bacterium BRH_c32]